MKPGNILVTGATGYVGEELIKLLQAKNHQVSAAGRRRGLLDSKIKFFDVGELSDLTDWGEALEQIELVIHCAGRAHQKGADQASEHFKVNFEATKKLFTECQKKGVKRFVFLSTIKVLGNKSGKSIDDAFKDDSKYQAHDAYSESKILAESFLLKESQSTQVVILRPSLIYGAKAKGFFGLLLKAVSKSWPLPLLGIKKNRRSLLYIGNLISALEILTITDFKGAKVYNLSDDQFVSTAEIVSELAKYLKTSGGFYLSEVFTIGLLRAFGLGAYADRIGGNLVVKNEGFKSEFGWTPAFTFQEGIADCVSKYRQGQGL